MIVRNVREIFCPTILVSNTFDAITIQAIPINAISICLARFLAFPIVSTNAAWTVGMFCAWARLTKEFRRAAFSAGFTAQVFRCLGINLALVVGIFRIEITTEAKAAFALACTVAVVTASPVRNAFATAAIAQIGRAVTVIETKPACINAAAVETRFVIGVAVTIAIANRHAVAGVA